MVKQVILNTKIAIGISDKTRRIEGIDQDEAHLNEILRTPFDFCVPTKLSVGDYSFTMKQYYSFTVK